MYMAETKVGQSDPECKSGMISDQQIKNTAGITGYSVFRVHIDEQVRHLDNLLSRLKRVNCQGSLIP